jgi:hypothetical protein
MPRTHRVLRPPLNPSNQQGTQEHTLLCVTQFCDHAQVPAQTSASCNTRVVQHFEGREQMWRGLRLPSIEQTRGNAMATAPHTYHICFVDLGGALVLVLCYVLTLGASCDFGDEGLVVRLKTSKVANLPIFDTWTTNGVCSLCSTVGTRRRLVPSRAKRAPTGAGVRRGRTCSLPRC